MLLSFSGSEQLVSPPNGHIQGSPANASSANGTSVVVWTESVGTNDNNIVAQRYDKAGAKVGSVIQVDASSANSLDPAVAMDSNGNFVVTWEDRVGSDINVRARYFTSSGAPLAAPFTVAGSSKSEGLPDVAASNGSFVVSYTLIFGAKDLDVHAHRYTVAGGVVTDAGDFVVAGSFKNENFARVAMTSDGAFDVAYDFAFSDTDTDIHLNRYSPAGNQLAGGVVVAGSSAKEIAPDIAMDGAGNAVVTYDKFDSSNREFDVKARRVGSNGSIGNEINIRSTGRNEGSSSVALAPTGGQFVVTNGSTSGFATDFQVGVTEVSATDTILATFDVAKDTTFISSVSVDGFNRYLVTYAHQFGSPVQSEVFSRRALLPSIGTETQVNPPSTSDQRQPANASSANGTSVVVWVDGAGNNIVAQLYDKAGAKVGGVIPVDVSGANSRLPAVAMDASGNFVVSWENLLSGGNTDVKVRYFNASGSPLTPALTVAASAKPEHDADVAASSGSFVVSYTVDTTATNKDVRVHRFTVANGKVTDAGDIAVASSAKDESQASVAMAPNGAFSIAYEFAASGTDDDIRLNRYSPAGALLAGNVNVSSTGDIERAPDIAIDNAGNAVVAYQKLDFVHGDFDIKARRVSGAGVVGSEFAVRSSALDDTNPSVALAPTGGQFVVAYDSELSFEVAEISAANTVKAISPRFLGAGPVISIDGLGRYTVTSSRIVGANGRFTTFKRRDFLS